MALRLTNDLACAIYIEPHGCEDALSAGKLTCRRPVNPQKKTKHMGDKSPKANQKKTTQKKVQVSSADQKKKLALAAKSAAPKKK